MEDVLYNAVLALTCVTQGSTKEKLYYELDLDTRLQNHDKSNFAFSINS